MRTTRRLLFANPAGWYCWLGFGLLLASVATPLFTAERTARVEGRAEQIVGLLREATRGFPAQLAADDAPIVLARFHALAGRDAVLIGDLEPLEPALPNTLLTLRNKHYLFHVAESPLDARAVASPGARPAYEALAWPMEAVGPGHSVYFHPDDAPRAFSRNLSAGYFGTGSRRPAPGQCHRRASAVAEESRLYRSANDERWIVF